ncbi:MAG: multicopper oxidase domain-containing protein [Nitrospirota bacterium]|nr:multicopper oxidase domain-containing protein [Nitrospirota bacterium]
MQRKNVVLGAALSLGAAAMLFVAPSALAKTVTVNLTAKEVPTVIDNKGTTQMSWTYEGQVPGPVVRVTEGDTVDFTLVNDAKNKNSHSIDFHAARVNVLSEFAPVKPGETKKFSFPATKPGVFFYHCGASNMAQHIARGMFGVIIVDPKKYSKEFPKPDREYVLIQSELYPNVDDVDAIMAGKWSNVVFNGGVLKYDPVHDPAATKTLVAKPGELVRVFFVNAGPHEFSAFHPIAGIWERAYPSGNALNVMYGMQTMVVGPGDAATFDLISPVPGGNAIVTHSLKQALTGAIAVIVFDDKADPKMGVWDGTSASILIP